MELKYLEHMGSDLGVVNAARVSFSKESTELGERDNKLIRYLATQGHWTPFAHTSIKCRVTVPIFLARQWYKHTVGATYNETSRRYVDQPPSYWSPEAWRARPDGSVKQGSGELLPNQHGLQEVYEELIEQIQFTYDFLLDQGVAPEQARAVLPQSMETEFVVTGSLVYWARLYNLRTEKTAQKEWLTITSQIDTMLTGLFPVSWKELKDGA